MSGAPPYDDADAPPVATRWNGGGRQLDDEVPPHDPEAEASLVGSMIHSPAAVEAARAILSSPEDIYAPGTRQVYRAILRLSDQGEPVDPVTVADELARTGKLEEAGGAGHLIVLHSSPPATSAAARYARITADYAAARRMVAFGRDVAAMGRSVPEDLPAALARVQGLAASLGGQATAATGSSWQAVDLGPALRGEQSCPAPGIIYRTGGPGLLYPGKVHGLAGEPESGKSWLALWAVAQVLTAGGRAVLLDFEDDETGIVGRLRALGATVAQVEAGFVYIRPSQALDDLAGRHLDQACADSTLAVVDGTTEGMAMHGWAPKNDVDVALWQARVLRRMAAHGCAVLAIDHVVKDRESRGRWATGSQHKLAGVDGASYLVEVRKPWAPGRSGLARLVVVKDRPGAVRAALEDLRTVGDMVVDSWPDGGVSIDLVASKPQETAGDGGHRPTVLMQRTSAFLAAHQGKSDPSTNAVRKGVRGDDGSIDRALVVLELEGYATSTKQGNGTYWQHVKPYTGDTEGD